MDKFTLKISGLARAPIYTGLFLLLVVGLFGNLSDYYEYGHVNWLILSIFIGIIIILFTFLAWSFSKTKLEIDGDNLTIKQAQKFVPKKILISFLFPKNDEIRTEIKNIHSVTITKFKKIKKLRNY